MNEEISSCCRLCLSSLKLQSIYEANLVQELHKYLNIEVNKMFVYFQFNNLVIILD